MAGMIFDDGSPTTNQPELDLYLARAREVAVGQRVVDVRSSEIEQDGKAVQAFCVSLENGQVLILFSPAAYGIAQQRQVFKG